MPSAEREAELLAGLMDPPPNEPVAFSAAPGEFRPKLNPVQQAVYDDDSLFILAYGERGCLAPDSAVFTENGMSRLSALEEGANVVSWNLKTTVLASAEKPAPSVKPAFDLRFEHGFELTCSLDHPLWVCAENASGTPSFGYWTVSRIQELRKAGWRFWSPLVAHPSWGTKELLVAHTSSGDHTLDEDSAYLLGAVVGDGSVNKLDEPGHTVSFANVDPDCLGRVGRAAGALGCFFTSYGGCNYAITPKQTIAPFLLWAGLKSTAYYKRIPDCIFASPKYVAAAFLRGLFDTDGCACKRGWVSYATTSEHLGRDIQRLLSAFGILATRSKGLYLYASPRPIWNLHIRGAHAEKFRDEIGFEIERKQKRLFAPKSKRRVGKKFSYPPSVVLAKSKQWDKYPRPQTRAFYAANESIYRSNGIPDAKHLDRFIQFAGSSEELELYRKGFAWVEVLDCAETISPLLDITVPSTSSYLADGLIHHNSGKTQGALHKLVKHCVNNINALAIIIVGVRRQAIEGGAAFKLTNEVLPEWKAGCGIEFTDWKSNTAKDDYIFISNKYGGWSRVLLLSMPVESFVRDRIRGMEPSLVLLDEAATLESDTYFSSVVQQLGRRPHISDPQQYIATCNPEGPSNWVYQRFFVKSLDENGLVKDDYAVHHVPISDNEHNLPPGYYDRIKEALADDEVEYRRMVLGEWIERPSGTSIFGQYFNDTLHVRGDPAGKTRLLPVKNWPIQVGYDLGTANSAVVFMQNVPTKEKDVWLIFDEMIYTDAYVPYTELVPAIMRRMKFWNDRMGYNYQYEHISDSSAFNQFRATSGTYDVLEVERLSRDVSSAFGDVTPIQLVECPKPPNSVQARVKVLIRALQQERLFLSSSCTKLRDMFLQLESEKLKDDKYSPDLPFKPRRSKHIHGFDALTYPMFFYELDTARDFLRTGRAKPEIIPIGTN